MEFCMITFRSVTPAQRAERLLKEAGVDCTIQRTPRWMSEQGCGYSLRVNCDTVYACLDFLETHGVAYKTAYTVEKNGVAEELLL